MHILFLVVVSIFNFKYLSNKRLNSYYFILISGLFFPLLIFKSRGSFLSFSIFFLLYLYLNKNYLRTSVIKLLFVIGISGLLFIQSSILVSDIDANMSETDIVITNLIENKETKKYVFFFL